MNTRFIIVFGVVFFAASAAFGQFDVQNWINPSGGAWETPGNWSPGPGPGFATFNLGSVAGYTTTLNRAWTIEALNLENDNAAIDLNGNSLFTQGIDVDASAGQSGQLAIVGPGSVSCTNSNGTIVDGLPFGLFAGNPSGTDTITINNATLYAQITGASINASGLNVINGGQITVGNIGSAAISNAVFNDGTFGGNPGKLSVSQVTLTNKSSISTFDGTITLSNATLDDSTISAVNGGLITGIVTLTDGASLDVADPNTTISGTVYISGGSSLIIGAAEAKITSTGTISEELSPNMNFGFGDPGSVDIGTLDFTLKAGFTPTLNEQFKVMGVQNFLATGTFATVNTPALPPGETWNLSQLYTQGVITVIVPEPMTLGMMTVGLTALAMRRRK